MQEILAHNTLEGKVSIEGEKRSAMKLNARPRIVICLPIGTKQKVNVFDTPDGQRCMATAASVPATVPIQWLMAQMKLVMPLGTSSSYLAQWGLLSGEARQILTTRALQLVQEDGYVLYWDDDVIVEPMSLYTMYSYMEQHPEIGAISGVYSTRQEPTEPVIYKEHMKGAYWGLTVGPNAEPEEIFGCGAGFLLVRAQAIRDAVAANPGVPIWADSKSVMINEAEGSAETRFNVSWGHDIRFCRLLREAGWPVYVDGRVELGHFDAVEQKEYRLPNDSPPKQRGCGASTKTRPGTVALVLPTYNALEYAAKAVASFKAHAGGLVPIVIAVDDASEGVTNESYANWARSVGADVAHRFANNGGLTRSWNHGLRVARSLGAEYAVAGNSDTIFSPGWLEGVVEALKDHDLAGPITNAAGWGCERQRYLGEFDDSPERIAAIAAELVGEPTITLDGPQVQYGQNMAQVVVPEFLNGFCLVAKTESWFAGAFDRENVFDPSKVNTENETELQVRWVVAQGARRALVRSSFVFHYRAVSRGEQYLCEGAFRPKVHVG